MGGRACVLPVAAADALRWAAGQLHDLDLVTRPAPQAPEAIFISNLPSRNAYREVLERCAHWHGRGARCLIARTANDVVDDHLLKQGCQVTYRENTGPASRYRFFAPPAVLAGWVHKFARRAPRHLSRARAWPGAQTPPMPAADAGKPDPARASVSPHVNTPGPPEKSPISQS